MKITTNKWIILVNEQRTAERDRQRMKKIAYI